VSCAGCERHDDEDGEIYWATGDPASLDGLLTDAGIPEELRAAVVDQLQCQGCGNSELSRFDEIGVESSEETAYRSTWLEWERKYASGLQDFAQHMERFPYLGLAHPFGRRIRRMIAGLGKGRLPETSWWRARKPRPGEVFASRDIMPPPPTKAQSEGRFNHVGKPLFYLCSDAQGALAETVAESERAWVQRFTVREREHVLDLTLPEWDQVAGVPPLQLGLFSMLDRPRADQASAWKPEYLIPRFVADCARLDGFDSILVASRKHLQRNLVLLVWMADDVVPDGTPVYSQLPVEERAF
jgi:hypothetical protein